MTEILQNITPEQIFSMAMAAIPSLAALISIVASVVKIFKDTKKTVQPLLDEFNTLKTEIKTKSEVIDGKDETIKALIAENQALRNSVADLITAINKVKYYDKEI